MSHDWESLVEWLHSRGVDGQLVVQRKERAGAGHGLFATETLQPLTKLLTVPADLLMNKKTLSSYYPSCSSLSATQLISLHLTLHHPDGADLDPFFGPYIATLPRDFDFHPLTWLMNTKFLQVESGLLRLFPPSVSSALLKLASRFDADWQAVVCVNTHDDLPTDPAQQTHPELQTRLIEKKDYLWSWLIVNTRCIYYQIKPDRSDPDNLTLCPVLDFANHSSTMPGMSLETSQSEIWIQQECGEDLTFFSPPNKHIGRDEELYLKYGAHCNRTLFVEYGFTDSLFCDGQLRGEVDVQDLVEHLFQEKDSLFHSMKNTLELDNYWGDWTLHAVSGSAYPSYRLITALRLYHLSDTVADFTEKAVQIWRETHLGLRESIDDDNENAWKQSVSRICDRLKDRVGKRPAVDPCMRCIDDLWEEELLVARAVLSSSDF